VLLTHTALLFLLCNHINPLQSAPISLSLRVRAQNLLIPNINMPGWHISAPLLLLQLTSQPGAPRI
jgi:hypothetical protein